MLRVDFSARKGEFLLRPKFEASDELVVLIGASGSGKSLTLKAIAGLLAPDAGEIVLPDGEVAFRASDGINLPPQRRSVGYVVQHLALFPHLSVRENIKFALHGRPRAFVERRTTELVSMLGLEGTEDRRPDAISGGQQQRVGLARALAGEPRLLLLDEPFSALEASLRTSLRRELLALRRRLGVTALFVTHDVDEAYTLADRIVVYHDGQVVQSGSRDDVFYRPATLEAAKLVGVRNFIAGDVIATAGGEATVRTAWFVARVAANGVAPGDRVYICIRPEHVLITRTPTAPHDPNDTVLEARVIDDNAHPLQHSLVMQLTGASVIDDSAPAPAIDDIAPPLQHSLVMQLAETEESKPPLLLEVDVPSHPYELLELSASACRTIVLPFTKLFLVK